MKSPSTTRDSMLGACSAASSYADATLRHDPNVTLMSPITNTLSRTRHQHPQEKPNTMTLTDTSDNRTPFRQIHLQESGGVPGVLSAQAAQRRCPRRW